jgi:hypothetical protein
MADPPETAKRPETASPSPMIARSRRRSGVESVFMRMVATAGIVGIGVALAAILVGQDVQGWVVGLAVSLTTVVLSAVLWSSRRL